MVGSIWTTVIIFIVSITSLVLVLKLWLVTAEFAKIVNSNFNTIALYLKALESDSKTNKNRGF